MAASFCTVSINPPTPPASVIGDEQADGHKGNELHHRFHRDGEDHAVLVFRGVDVAGAEEDGEDRHRHA
jgi:hypothetical protein